MSQPETGVRTPPSRAAQIAVGAVAVAIGIALIFAAVLVLYRVPTATPQGGPRNWILIAAPALLGSFLALTGASFVRGARGKAAEPLPPDRVRRWPFLAGTLSLLAPGLGQLYNGQWVKAATFYLATSLVVLLWLRGVTGRFFWGLLLSAAAVLALQTWAIVDAIVVASRSPVIPRHRFASWWLLVPTAVALLLVPRALLSLQVVKTYYHRSGSMALTLPEGDRVVADLGYFDHHPLEVGTVVIFRSLEEPSVDLVKRVVALAGDRVEIRDKALFVNGKPVREPWVVHRDPLVGRVGKRGQRDNFGPFVVPKDAFFVLGDNRDESYDSRFYGPIPRGNLRGKVLFIYWSLDRRRIGRVVE